MKTITQNIVIALSIAALIQAPFIDARYRTAPKPQITLSHPLETIETARLIIRPFEFSDAPQLLQVYLDESTQQFLPFTPDRTIEDTEARIKRYKEYEKGSSNCYWAVILKKTNTLIGQCGFYGLNRNSASIEGFLMIRSDYWNLGLATEAMRASCEYAFTHMGINRIEATAYSENYGSIATCKKIGFSIIGTIEEFVYYKGAFWDRVIMSLTKEAFSKQCSCHATACHITKKYCYE